VDAGVDKAAVTRTRIWSTARVVDSRCAITIDPRRPADRRDKPPSGPTRRPSLQVKVELVVVDGVVVTRRADRLMIAARSGYISRPSYGRIIDSSTTRA